jgi:hypothetical protein
LPAAPSYVDQGKNNRHGDPDVKGIGPRNRRGLEEVAGSVVAVVELAAASGRQKIIRGRCGFRGSVHRRNEWLLVDLRLRSGFLRKQMRDLPIFTGSNFAVKLGPLKIGGGISAITTRNSKIRNIKIRNMKIRKMKIGNF